jgi:hypothetical protein
MRTILAFTVLFLLNNSCLGQDPILIALKKNIKDNKLNIDTIFIKGSSFTDKVKIVNTTLIPVGKEAAPKDSFATGNKIWIEIVEVQNRDTLTIVVNNFQYEGLNESTSQISLFGSYQYVFKKNKNQKWQFLKSVRVFS